MNLTPMQQSILQQVVNGMTYKQIAKGKKVNFKTILTQASWAKQKNNCVNRDQLILKAYKAGLIEVNF